MTPKLFILALLVTALHASLALPAEQWPCVWPCLRCEQWPALPVVLPATPQSPVPLPPRKDATSGVTAGGGCVGDQCLVNKTCPTCPSQAQQTYPLQPATLQPAPVQQPQYYYFYPQRTFLRGWGGECASGQCR